MNIEIKPGVDMSQIDPRIWERAWFIAETFNAEGVPAVITSAKRPIKGKFSFHWIGCAIDWRGNHLPNQAARERVFDALKALGPDFDVIMYDISKGGHYHVEYDPR